MLSTATVVAAATAGYSVHPLLILPFGLLLLSIATIPLINQKWWEHYYPFVATGLGAVTLCYYLFIFHDTTAVIHVIHEYVSFIALIGSLFVVSGGIHISTKGQATPFVNCMFLAVGAILSNIVGTTGASMLLIRPWIRMNKRRITSFHIVFFIFVISNISGALTPIGDPPLFLGYLRGVHFWWPLEHCWPGWLAAIIITLLIFYIFDLFNFKRVPAEVREIKDAEPNEKFKISGLSNIFFLLMVLCAVFIEKPVMMREALMIAAAVGSYLMTPKKVHEANNFNFQPIKEVGWLFIGIFLTMVPALSYLGSHAGSFGIDSSMKFFWCTGLLSGVLDNAPTYLTFLATAMGLFDLDVSTKQQVLEFATQHGHHLVAISLGSVFFGAMTYIGNGPNFMVKSIADQAKIQMPTFFGYIFKFSIPFLVPIFLLVSLLFFSKWALF